MSRAKKPRLLFIAPVADLRGGANMSLLEMLIGAQKRGYAVHCVVPGLGTFASSLKQHKIPCTVIKYDSWHPTHLDVPCCVASLRAIEKIAQTVQNTKADIVISKSLQVPWGAMAAAYANKPHVWVACEYPTYGSSYLLDRYGFVAASSAMVFANSKWLADYMRDEHDVPNCKYYYSFVDEQKLQLNNGLKRQRIVCVGDINENKGQLAIVEAVNELRKHHKVTPKVVLIGDCPPSDPYAQKLRQAIKQRGLSKQVELLGYKASPYKFVGPNDIFVQPSGSESIGRTLVEALKLGLVCVGADIPGTREGFSLAGGLLYRSGDYRDLARVLQATIEDFPAHRQLAAQAQQKVIQTQSEAKCHDLFFAGIDHVGVAKSKSSNPVQTKALLSMLGQAAAGAQKQLDANQRTIAEQIATIERYRRDVDKQTIAITGYQQQLNDIFKSDSWRAVQIMRKLLRRG